MLGASPIRRPVLRYHGGKFGIQGAMADWIVGHFPEHRIYTEVFGGAASVLMRKPRSYAEVYNDLAEEIVNVFRVLRNPGQAGELDRLVRLTPFARLEFEEAYQWSNDPVERARRTIFRSMAGHGSAAATKGYRTGFRKNSHRSGTVAAIDWMNYPDHIASFTERLRGVTIENRPAVDVLGDHDAHETLNYVDPPYVHSTRRAANKYDRAYEHELTDDNHRELAEVLHGLKGMVVLSGYECPLYDDLFGTWSKVTRRALADGARPRTECLWLNPAATRRRDLFQAAQVAS